MGQEAKCTVRCGRRSSTGTALLESAELVFRGSFRLTIPFREIQEPAVEGGCLVVRFPGGTARFDLGERAARWAEKIRNPRGLLDKLGVKPGARVAVLGLPQTSFTRELSDRTRDIAKTRPRKGSDLIFLGAGSREDLRRIATLQGALKPEGALWVVWLKGRPELREDDVRRAAIQAGLVDVKVVSFSETHSALKLVVPVARRPGAPRST